MPNSTFDKTTSDFLTPADAARISGVTPAAIRQAARSGRLPVSAKTAGGIHLFVRKDVERFAAGRGYEATVLTQRDKRQADSSELTLPFDDEAVASRGDE
jgi:hypothetical protein